MDIMAYLILLVLVSLCPSMAGMAASKVMAVTGDMIRRSRNPGVPKTHRRNSEEIASLVIDVFFYGKITMWNRAVESSYGHTSSKNGSHFMLNNMLFLSISTIAYHDAKSPMMTMTQTITV